MSYKHFSQQELACKCKRLNCEFKNIRMNHSFMQIIDEMREEAGFPFIVTSALRCPDYNRRLSSSKSLAGPHTTGRAIDIACQRTDAYKIIELAIKYGITGIGINQKGQDRTRFIHLDDLLPCDGFPVRPTIWSY